MNAPEVNVRGLTEIRDPELRASLERLGRSIMQQEEERQASAPVPQAAAIARKPTARVHPDDRGRVERLNAMAAVLQGTPKQKTPISYYAPILLQCTLPHSDPKTRDWVRTNGDFSLIVSSGVDKNLEPYGVPYGSFPRLVLAYIITRVIQTQARRVDLALHFRGFLNEVGYTSNHRGTGIKGQRIRNQLVKLLRASIAFEGRWGTEEAGRLAGININVASKYDLWWDVKNPEQESLWGSYVEISEEFRQAILSAPVPLRTDILKALHKSPLALDVYMWVSYRLFIMHTTGQESVSLGYGRLQEQFGTGIAEANYRQFRHEFKAAWAKVASLWREKDGEKSLLNYELNSTGLVLYRSPLLIAPAQASGAEVDIQRMLASRSLDQETRRSARQVAGSWDVAWLESQYFNWIAKAGITPKDLRAHFLDFVRTHRVRNGEAL